MIMNKILIILKTSSLHQFEAKDYPIHQNEAQMSNFYETQMNWVFKTPPTFIKRSLNVPLCIIGPMTF